jgi:ankyrin repeat protein
VPQENKIEDCKSALFLTDPVDDREQLISFKGRLVASACSWVVQNATYKNWKDGSNQSQLLWLCGDSGTGKTMLSIFLTESLQKALQGERSAVLIYYFCDGRNERRNHAVSILRGLIYQLLQKRPELIKLLLPDFLVQKANLFMPHSLEPLWRIFESIARDPSTGLVYCVIDGLDECHSGSLEHFLKKVKMFYSAETNGSAPNDLVTRSPSAVTPLNSAVDCGNDSVPARHNQESWGLKMMLVSRQEPSCLPSELATFPRLELALDASNNYSSGLRAFIDAKVAKMSAVKGYSDSDREKVSQALQDCSEGSFLWAGMATDEIETSASIPIRASDDVHRLPHRVDYMYIDTIRRIPLQHRNRMVAVFRWVVLARRPLTLAELLAAINIRPFAGGLCQPHELHGGITSCSKLLSITGEEVALAHQSVKDFFLETIWEYQKEYTDLQHFTFNQDQVHADIASACLEYITSGALRAGKSISLKKPSHFGERAQLRNWPLLAYAIIYWPDHARMTSPGSINFSSAFFDKKSKLFAPWWVSYWMATSPAAAWSWVAPKDFNLAHLACYCGILSLAIDLKNKGILSELINANDSHMAMPAEYAVEMGHENLLAFMLDNGAKIEYKYGGSLLHDAARKGHLQMVQLILAKGVHPDTQGDTMDATDLKLWGLAALYTPVLVLQVAKDRKESSSNWHLGIAGTGKGDHPLHRAAEYGHEEVVKLLISKGAHIHAQTTQGFAPLHYAAFNGQKHVVQLLLKYGADMNVASKEGWTPLHAAARTGNTETVRVLISQGCNANAVTTKLKTALHFAIAEGHLETARCLIRQGINLNVADRNGRTALLLAQELNKVELVQSLVNAGADTEVRIAGKTALMRARDKSQLPIVSVLEKGPVPEDDQVPEQPAEAISADEIRDSEKTREERSREPSFSEGHASPPPPYHRDSSSSLQHAYTPAAESHAAAASSKPSAGSPVLPNPTNSFSSNVCSGPISRMSSQMLEENAGHDAEYSQNVPDTSYPLQFLQALWSTFYTEWVPACMEFTMDPPAGMVTRRRRYNQLSEGILTKVLLAADEVKTEGIPEAKDLKKKLIDHANEYLGMLDNVPKSSTSRAPSSQMEDQSTTPSHVYAGQNTGLILPVRSAAPPHLASSDYTPQTGSASSVMAYSSRSPGYDPPPLPERCPSPFLMSSSNNSFGSPPIISTSPPTTSHQNLSAYFDNSRISAQPSTAPTSYSYPPNPSQYQPISFKSSFSPPPTQPQYQSASTAVSFPPPPPPPLPPRSPTPSLQPLYQPTSYSTTATSHHPPDVRQYSTNNRLLPYLSSSTTTTQQLPPPPPIPSPHNPTSGLAPGMYFPPPPPTPALRRPRS